jgi:hypothetical protein
MICGLTLKKNQSHTTMIPGRVKKNHTILLIEEKSTSKTQHLLMTSENRQTWNKGISFNLKSSYKNTITNITIGKI